MTFTVDFTKLTEALNELGVKTGVAALRKAGRKAMKPVLDYQKENANEDTGALKDSIGMSARTGGRKAKERVLLISVGPIKKTGGRGENKRELTGINQKAIAQEYGNIKTKAEPFIRPSLETNKNNILESLKSEFKNEFEKIKK